MAESKENVKDTESYHQEDSEVEHEHAPTSSTEKRRLTLINGIWFVTGLIEVVLAFRLVLRLFGANPASGFVDFIYTVSGPFVAPFSGIFSSPTTEGDMTVSVFETGTIVALVVYALIAWGLVKLVNLNRR